jgi:chromosome segregation ATPase
MPSASSTLAADSDMNLSAALGFDVEGDDSAVFDNPRDLGVPSASDRAFFVREETERVASLERMNFDLKMKVFYMEEQMRKLSDSAGQEDAADELREQNNQLRGDLEERTLEVEQRNALLVKAKQAIEALKAEVAKLRSEDSSGSAARLEEAESRVRAALRNAEAMEAKHAADCERLQLKISSLEQTLALKDQLLSSVDDKAKASTSSLSSVSAELDSAHATIAKLEDQCRSYQKKLQEINQQLIDCRSDCDIAQIELAEQIDVCNSLSQRAEELRAAGLRAREELARTQAEAARSEQELKKRLDSTTTEYESLLQAAKASAEQVSIPYRSLNTYV